MKKQLLSLAAFLIMLTHANAQCTNACTFVASAQATGSSSSVTVNKPAGVQQGDLMIGAVHTGWCNAGSSVTPPTGWTLINETSNTASGCGSGNTSVLLATFYKIAGASEPSSYTFTGSTTQIYVGGIVAYSGVDTLNPINASSSNGNQDLCSAIVAPGVTTTAACTRIVTVSFCSVNNWATNIIPQGSMTERMDIGTTGNNPWGNENLEIADESLSAAGATGTRSALLSGCSGNGWITGAQMIALQCQVTTSDLNEQFTNEGFNVLPNPSAGIFEIALSNKPATKTDYEIIDCLGKTVKQAELTEKKTVVDLSACSKGIYFIKIHATGGTHIKKIMLQ